MKAPDRQRLSEMLRRVADAPSPPPAEAFWEDFRARAAITDQVEVDQVERVPSLWLSWRTGVAAAAALAVVCALLVLQIPGNDTIVAAAPVAGEGSLSEVEEVEVFSDYSSVLIVEDEENGGTVIWVAGTDVASVP